MGLTKLSWSNNADAFVHQCRGSCRDTLRKIKAFQERDGQIKDEVKVPGNLAPGAYVLSWRWDAEGSGQIWSGCANIEIV